MKRLTSIRCSGIKSGYWSPHKKDDLVQRLGAYEDTGLTPEEIRSIIREKQIREEGAEQSNFNASSEMMVIANNVGKTIHVIDGSHFISKMESILAEEAIAAPGITEYTMGFRKAIDFLKEEKPVATIKPDEEPEHGIKIWPAKYGDSHLAATDEGELYEIHD